MPVRSVESAVAAGFAESVMVGGAAAVMGRGAQVGLAAGTDGWGPVSALPAAPDD